MNRTGRISGSSLLRDRAFFRVWLAFTLSQVGASLALMALPLLAASSLRASPLEMSILAAMQTIPFVIFGPFAGVAADRWRRRLILVVADLMRAAVLVSVPLAALTGHLTIELLLAVAFVVGTGNTWFDICHGSYLPTIVERRRLLEAHSRFSLSQSVTDTAGPLIGGGLVQSLGAPLAILGNALSYLISGLLLAFAPDSEPTAANLGGRTSVWSDIADGVRFVYRHALLRSLTLRLAAWHFVVGGIQSMLIFHLARNLEMSAGKIGLLFSMTGAGTVLGATCAQALSRRIGVGPTIVLCNLLAAFLAGLIPLAGAASVGSLVLIGSTLFGFGFCVITYQITNASLRQAVTENAYMGRMSAATRVVALGTNACGAVVAGVVAQTFDARIAIAAFAALGIAFALKGATMGQLRAVKSLPIA
ncbi:MAG: MFS transporter [Steroidobacteraceae bacterium]